MLFTYFLFVIFGGYVLYGMSSSLHGSVWTQIAGEVGVDIGALGTIVAIIYITSGISCVLMPKIRKKIGNNYSIVLSIVCFIITMIFFISSKNIWLIYIAAAFLGFGSGLIDATANNYVIRYHQPSDVSFLHACWGIGAALGPIMMSYSLTSSGDYRNGFKYALYLLVILAIVLLVSKRFWENKKKTLDAETVEKYTISDEEKKEKVDYSIILKNKYVLIMLICYLFCQIVNCGFNSWLATIFVQQRGINVVDGAKASTFFFGSLTIARVLIGFLSKYMKTHRIIVASFILCAIASLLMCYQTANLSIIYINASILGISVAELIPFLNYALKEYFGEKELPVLLSSCNVIGFVSAALSGKVVGLFVNGAAVHYVQLIFVIASVVGLALYVIVANGAKKV